MRWFLYSSAASGGVRFSKPLWIISMEYCENKGRVRVHPDKSRGGLGEEWTDGPTATRRYRDHVLAFHDFPWTDGPTATRHFAIDPHVSRFTFHVSRFTFQTHPFA
jgi:hypothetical protein